MEPGRAPGEPRRGRRPYRRRGRSRGRNRRRLFRGGGGGRQRAGGVRPAAEDAPVEVQGQPPEITVQDPGQDAHLRMVVQRDPFVGSEDEDPDRVLVGNLGDVEVPDQAFVVVVAVVVVPADLQPRLDPVDDGTAPDTARNNPFHSTDRIITDGEYRKMKEKNKTQKSKTNR